MKESAARSVIRRTLGWVLVMLYDGGDVEWMDATTEEAERQMVALPDCVVGIYRREHLRYFSRDLGRTRKAKRVMGIAA